MSIKAIKRRYVKKYLPQTVEELNWYREQSSLRSAVELAALAIDRKGKRHAHQRRLSRSALEKAKEVLVANIESLERAKDFDGLIHLIKALLDSVTGIGELYVYDTSLRIGARLGLSPEKVYLHAGTREGAKALGISRKVAAIEPGSLPAEFHELEPCEIEDVLCIFKDILERERIKTVKVTPQESDVR